jgi:predicted nucleic acid-binding protein
MKIVLDTNVVISGILWKGPSNEILRLIEINDNLQFVQKYQNIKILKPREFLEKFLNEE